VDIGNINTSFGEINSVTMLGKDATSSRMRRVIYENTVIVSTTRPTRNAIAIVPTHLDNQICSTGFAVLECRETIIPDYLFFILRSKFVTHQFQRLSSGSGYPEINQEEDLPKVMIPKPDNLEIQQEIVDKLKVILNEAKKMNRESKRMHENSKVTFKRLVL
jgi:type I restriction enzyme S subunit